MADRVKVASSLNPEAPAYFPNIYEQSDVVFTSHGLYLPLNYLSSLKSPFNCYPQQNSPHLFSYSFYTYPNQSTAPPSELHPVSVAPITDTSHPGPVLDRTHVIADEAVLTGRHNHGESSERFRRPGRGNRGFYHREEWRPVVPCSNNYLQSGERYSEDSRSNILVGDFGERRRRRRKFNGGCSARKARRRHAVEPVCRYGDNTTVMIKNIPSKYTRKMLIDFLDNHCMMENQKSGIQSCNEDDEESKEAIVSAFDFLYLPIDFKSGLNKGYAFVNFTEPRAVWKFYLASKDQSWDFFNSKKRREIVCARLQGKEQLVEQFEGMAFPCQDYLPVIFSPARDGSRELVKESMVGRLISSTWPPSLKSDRQGASPGFSCTRPNMKKSCSED